jgi:hypothetical protein
VLAGNLTSNGTVDLAETPDAWLTQLRATGAGQCQASVRAPVNFGRSTAGGCLLQLAPADFADCQSVRQQALDLLAPPGQHVASRIVGKYGNSSQLVRTPCSRAVS